MASIGDGGRTKMGRNGKHSGRILRNMSDRTGVDTRVTCGCALLRENQSKFTRKFANNINAPIHNFTYIVNIIISKYSNTTMSTN